MAGNSADAQALWQRYEQHPSITEKNALVVHYLPAVKKIALGLMPAYRAYVDLDDMLSSGAIGLMDAIDRYDASRDARFESYSAMRIRGEILDGIRAQDWASDSLRRRIKAAARARSALEQRIGREPSIHEIAAHMGVEEAALRNALEKEHAFSTVYLEDMAAHDAGWEHLVQGGQSSPEETAEKHALTEALGSLIDSLPKKERLVISLYYYEELTQREIAQVLGVTEARICQLRSSATARLRSGIQRIWTE